MSSIVISSATGIQNNFLNAGDNVSVTATFNESVTVDTASGTPTLTLVVGSTNRTATYASGSGSTSLVFQYTIQAGETDDNGISIEANVLALNSSTIKDAVLNNATLTHSAVSANTSYKVDTTLPTVSSVEITSATGMLNNSLNAGDVVSVRATFNEIVIRTGSPQLTIVVGSTERTATYTSGSGSTSLVFQYTIQAGETDDNGISIGADVLALNSGTIRDRPGHNATLTHSAVSANTSYKVDTTAPTVDNFTISDSLLTIGETATVDLVFSEAVFGFASAADITDPSGSLA
ncbi:MAG TPA: Ig-like domain-containing protein, partial [Candidatus Thalassarchaeaceae archaeon]|nr:Ig-like domain-containing protein [Candidatus Thalassarchaeaceae archaeon]